MSMYIKRLHLDTIRCFEQLEIEFGPPGTSVLILGDNGDGKSTIMRCLAMGLCDESSAAALFRELPGEFVRREIDQTEVPPDTSGHITVELFDEDDDGKRSEYKIVTKITSLKRFERVTQEKLNRTKPSRKKLDQDTFPWERFFVSGYGAGTRTHGTANYKWYLPVDAVYPIFNYDYPLQNPELAVRRLSDAAFQSTKQLKEGKKRSELVLEKVKKVLADVLSLESSDCVALTSTGITVRGRWGKAELAELGDGYKATVTWILDLISWWFLYFFESDDKIVKKKWKEFQKKELQGIVLIDEIDQHLHPRWQSNVLSLLSRSFPKIQFIATTHSPLVASGSDDVIVYQLSDEGIERVNAFGWLAEDVYRNMGLVRGSRAKVFRTDILDEFKELDWKRLKGKANARDLAKLKLLRTRLDKLPENDPLRLTTEVENIKNELIRLRQGGK